MSVIDAAAAFAPGDFRQFRTLDGTRRCAALSADGVNRYLLAIEWDPSRTPCAFVMLNPSTATEEQNDPTVERCERRARLWGYGALLVVNLFALRSTDPAALYENPDPVGSWNDFMLSWASLQREAVVCGWGTHGKLRGRGDQVRRLLAGQGLSALRVNADGSPAHPLYLPYSLLPSPYGVEP
jgi:hypothetical protein